MKRAHVEKQPRLSRDKNFTGAGCKTWHAFLSTTKDASGNPVNAIERVGEGPWYDRIGRLVAMTKDDLLQPWPRGADPSIMYDLPNEFGVPNHNPDTTLHCVARAHGSSTCCTSSRAPDRRTSRPPYSERRNLRSNS